MKDSDRLKRQAVSALSIGTIVIASGLSACAVDPVTGQPSLKETFASNDPCAHNSRNIGVLAGAGLGAAVAVAARGLDPKAIALGATAGAAAGGLIGYSIDNRRCALSKIAKQYGLEMEFADVDSSGQVVDAAASEDGKKSEAAGQTISIRDSMGEAAQFESGSDQLTARSRDYFSAIAAQYALNESNNVGADTKAANERRQAVRERRLMLVGHTDDTGSSASNADLSERRAYNVAKFLSEHGVPAESIFYQGAGETLPIADNRTEAGRAKNRRVEIVEVSNENNFRSFLEARAPKVAYYRAVPKPAASVTMATIEPATQPAPAAPAPEMRTGKSPLPESVATTIDFGGSPVNASNAVLAYGSATPERSSFSLISIAYADDPTTISRCDRDRPRVAGPVRTLQGNRVYSTTDFLTGLYQTTWTDRVNGHQVVLNKVAVLRDPSATTGQSELKVYTNYNPAKNRNPKAAVAEASDVNIYRGTDGIVYRVFAKGSAGVQCLDVLFPKNGGFDSIDGRLIYGEQDAPFVSPIHMTILK